MNAYDLDLKKKWFDFECRMFDTFPGEDYFWMKKPEYARFQKKIDGKYEPSLQFESAESGRCFWVDCIYVPDFDDDGNICIYQEADYIERMRDYDLLEDPVFIAVAVGDAAGPCDDFIFDHISEFAFHTMNNRRFRELITPLDIDSLEGKMKGCI